MSLWLACKAFWRALRNPAAARIFIEGKESAAKGGGIEKGGMEHLRLLAVLQRTGRLVDFLQEDIEAFDDAQIGAAVREVHKGSRQCLEEFVVLRPVLEEGEGAEMRIPKGYDAARLKVVGNVVGEPPYVGYVVHRGWQARKRSLPHTEGPLASTEIIAPAEIEVR